MDIEKIIYSLINQEYSLFPKAKIQDYYKLLFQSTFGAEHMLGEYNRYFDSIYKEMFDLKAIDSIPLYYKIGLDIPLARVNLAKCKADGISAEIITKTFVNGARVYRSKYSTGFELLVRLLIDYLAKQPFQIKGGELTDFFSRISELGFPTIHHSKIYKKQYKPHYRVIPLNIWENTVKKLKL